MVVNRKQPAIPVPPSISRSSSTQPVPTKRTTKNAPKSTLTQNGHEIDSRKPQTTAHHKASKKHKTKKRSSLLDRLFLLSLSLFTFYTIYTCRPNPLFPSPLPDALSDSPNPVCRSLAVYHTSFLEPYVLPPLKQSISYAHTLAEPYIERTQVTIEPYTAPLVRAVKVVRPYVTATLSTSKKVWTDTLVPLYTNTLKPYYDTAVVPRYKIYIHPRLVPLGHKISSLYRHYVANPVRVQFARAQRAVNEAYAAYLRPYVIQIQPYVESLFSALRSVSIRVWELYTTHVHPRVVAGWATARPVLCQAWKHARKTTVQAVKKAAKEVGQARRMYVDPHVKKIWDKVADPADNVVPESEKLPIKFDPTTLLPSTRSHASSSAESTHTADGTVSILHSINAYAEETHSSEPEPEPTVVEGAVPTVSILHPIGAYAKENVVVAIPEDELVVTPEEEVVLKPEEEVAVTPEKAAVLTPEEVVVTPEEVIVIPEEVVVAIPEEEVVLVIPEPEPTVAETASSPDPDDDLDDFLRDIGVDSTTITPTPTATLEIETQQTPAEPDPDVLEKIAAKRADIIAKHNSWFDQLDEAIAEESEVLPKKLTAWREEKVVELVKMRDVDKVVEAVDKDGEKLVRGAEGYLKKAEGRSSAWKVPKADEMPEELKEEVEKKKEAAEKEKEKWDTVLAKVQEKFNERVRKLQGEVHGWYQGVRDGEMTIIFQQTYPIKLLAERGQADLGLHYAWLEDVTYEDWQRYHDLVRAYEHFYQTAVSLANGTHPDAPADPVVDVLDKLDQELGDVVLGFEVAMGRLRGEGAGVFRVYGDGEEDGFFVVKDGERRRDDFRGVDFDGLQGVTRKEGAGVVGLSSEEEKEKGGQGEGEEVRILPIDPHPQGDERTGAEGEEKVDVNRIIIGKDKVVIEEALKDVPLANVVEVHAHEEL